jgi:triphosphatase
VRSTFTKRRRLISTEFELKLAAPAAKLEKLKRALLAMPTVKSEVRSKLVSTYYDTPTLALHRERLSFRVRKQGPEFVQTAKAENPAQVDMLERREWEDHIPGKRPVLDAPKTGKRLPDMVRDEELRPVFTTTVTRTVIEITPDPLGSRRLLTRARSALPKVMRSRRSAKSSSSSRTAIRG